MIVGYKGFINPQNRLLEIRTDNYVCKIHAGNSFIQTVLTADTAATHSHTEMLFYWA